MSRHLGDVDAQLICITRMTESIGTLGGDRGRPASCVVAPPNALTPNAPLPWFKHHSETRRREGLRQSMTVNECVSLRCVVKKMHLMIPPRLYLSLRSRRRRRRRKQRTAIPRTSRTVRFHPEKGPADPNNVSVMLTHVCQPEMDKILKSFQAMQISKKRRGERRKKPWETRFFFQSLN